MIPITVHPDPQEPAGGFAFLELPQGTFAADETRLALFDPYAERWLGPAGAAGSNWQTLRHNFGPLAVLRHDGADWVRLGPEIVDSLLSDMPLTATMGEVQGRFIWPEDIRPRPRMAASGALRPVVRHRDPQKPALAGVVVPPKELPPTEPAPIKPEVADTASPPSLNRRWWFLGLLALLALAAAGYWFFVADGDPAPGAPQSDADPCSLTALQALDGGFPAIEAAIRDCGAKVSADTALHLIEEGARAEDPAALYLFGTLYDGQHLDPRVENLIGLTFEDDPAQAAEYYARAVGKGSKKAEARLTEICKTLPGEETTLARGAHDDYCR